MMKWSSSSTGSSAMQVVANYRDLAAAYEKSGRDVDDNVFRKTLKQIRVGLVDRSTAVQVYALKCLRQCIRANASFITLGDFRTVSSMLVKKFQILQKDLAVRREASLCMAELLYMSLTKESEENRAHRDMSSRIASIAIDNSLGPNIEGFKFNHITDSSPLISLDLESVLAHLQKIYSRPTANRQVLACVFLSYARLFELLQPRYLEDNLPTIFDHIFNLLLSSTDHPSTFKMNLLRRHTLLLLDNMLLNRLLNEMGKIKAVKALCQIVFDHSHKTGSSAPSSVALIVALNFVSALCKHLGSAVMKGSENLQEYVLNVLEHGDLTVELAGCKALVAIVSQAPATINACLDICLQRFEHFYSPLIQSKPTLEVQKIVLGYGFAITELLGLAFCNPIYAHPSSISKLIEMSLMLFKCSANSEVTNAAVQVQIAWDLTSKMMLGSHNFVKSQFPRLLTLWKNALPKPLPPDISKNRSALETAFLLHVRTKSLECMRMFILNQPKLLTSDVRQKLFEFLFNSIGFLKGLTQKRSIPESELNLCGLSATDIEIHARKEVMLCLTLLLESDHASMVPAEFLSQAMYHFTEPISIVSTFSDNTAPQFFEDNDVFWCSNEEIARGITSMAMNNNLPRRYLQDLPQQNFPSLLNQYLYQTNASYEEQVNTMIYQPLSIALEHNRLLQPKILADTQDMFGEPLLPPMTQMVDAAINLFAEVYSRQPAEIRKNVIINLEDYLAAPKMSNKDNGKHLILLYNIITAIYRVIKRTTSTAHQDSRFASESLQMFLGLLHGLMRSEDLLLRTLTSNSLGRVCQLLDRKDLANEIKHLEDLIITIREPYIRASCASALGWIHKFVGGMAANLYMKSTIGLLMSLSKDPHPTVHCAALEALSILIDASGLGFIAFQMPILTLLTDISNAQSHNPLAMELSISNIAIAEPCFEQIMSCLNSVINVIGPDLQYNDYARYSILPLIKSFLNFEQSTTVAAAMICLQSYDMFASCAEVHELLTGLIKQYISHAEPWVQRRACSVLYQLVQKDAQGFADSIGNDFIQDIWKTIDHAQNYNLDLLRKVISVWVEQSAFAQPKMWTQICLRVLSRSSESCSEIKEDKVDGFADESSSFADSMTGPQIQNVSGASEFSWQTQAFAVDCLRIALMKLRKSSSTAFKVQDENVGSFGMMTQQVGDLIRISFTASTSNALELRLSGLNFLHEIIISFKNCPDPEFPENRLLELYQAQIGSALTPAFSADSSPELAAQSLKICAEFTAIGVSKDTEKSSRIIKYLINGLESCTLNSEQSTVGELVLLSDNARTMIRLATLCAWAELQIRSNDKISLSDILSPRIKQLLSLWLEALNEYATIIHSPDRDFEAEAVTIKKSGISIEVELYQISWLTILKAIITALEQNITLIAILGNEDNVAEDAVHQTRQEPAAFFFVLYGICFDAILQLINRNDYDEEELTSILQCVRRLLDPCIAGQAVYQSTVFSELMILLERTILIKIHSVQEAIIELAEFLAVNHPADEINGVEKSHSNGLNGSNEGFNAINRYFELARIVVLALQQDCHWLKSTGTDSAPLSVIRKALKALMAISKRFPDAVRLNFYETLYHIFIKLFECGKPCLPSITAVLPIFKQFCSDIENDATLTSSNSTRAKNMQLAAFSQIVITSRRAFAEGESVELIHQLLIASALMLMTNVESVKGSKASSAFHDLLISGLTWNRLCFISLQVSRVILCNVRSRESFLPLLVPKLVAQLCKANLTGSEEERFKMEGLKLLVELIGGAQDEKESFELTTIALATILFLDADRPEMRDEIARVTIDLIRQNPATVKTCIAASSEERKKKLQALCTVRPRGKENEQDRRDAQLLRVPTISLKINFDEQF